MLTSEEKEKSLTGNDDELVHTYCCMDEDVGLCGADVSDAPVLPQDWKEDLCVVCIHLEKGDYCPTKSKCVYAKG